MSDETSPEVAALKQRVDELSDKLHDVRTEQQRRNQELVETLRAFGLDGEQIEAAVRRFTNHGMTRRAALLAIVGAVGAGGFIAGTERAQAAATGEMGTAADPIQDIFAQSVDAGAVTADELNLAPLASVTTTFTGGETKLLSVPTANWSPGDTPVIATATPWNDPGNDHGYTEDGQLWEDANTRLRVRITETENAGGGDARIVIWGLGE